MPFTAARGELERELENAIDANARHHGFLDDELTLSTGKHASAYR